MRSLMTVVALVAGLPLAPVPGFAQAVGGNPVPSIHEEQASRITGSCNRLGDAPRTDCYVTSLTDLARRAGVSEALAVLESIAARVGEVYADGHMFTHAIGVAAHDPERPFGPQFDACTELFHAGCYHGLLQAHFRALSHVGPQELNGLCAEVGNGRRQMWIVFQCVHGLGHGLLGYHGQDLIAALASCDALLADWDRSSCYGGALMENVVHATLPHHASLLADRHDAEGSGGHGHAHSGDAAHPFEPLRADDLHYPCSVLAEHYQADCYAIQTSVILHFNGRDYEAAAVTCDQAPAAYRQICHQSLGRDATGDASRDHTEVNRLCGLNGSAYAEWCWAGAAKAMVDWTGDPRDGLSFCRSVFGEQPRLRCFEAVGEEMLTVVADVEGRRRFCAEAGDPHTAACARGARLE